MTHDFYYTKFVSFNHQADFNIEQKIYQLFLNEIKEEIRRRFDVKNRMIINAYPAEVIRYLRPPYLIR